MNLIEKALRYIYIYILTSKAGWAYDRQSREVWKRRKREDNGGENLSKREHSYFLLGRERNDAKHHQVFDGHDHHYCEVTYSDLGKLPAQRNGRRRRCHGVQRELLHFPSRRLTSKEVAA